MKRDPIGHWEVMLWATVVLCGVAMLVISLSGCRPAAPVTIAPQRTITAPIGVWAEDYRAPTRYAMSIWNSAARCELFRPSRSPDVIVQAADGEPCGDMDPGLQIAGGAYRCMGGHEIHVYQPGDIRQQFVIIAHELGHVLGLGDQNRTRTIMYEDSGIVAEQAIVWPADGAIAAVQREWCPHR